MNARRGGRYFLAGLAVILLLEAHSSFAQFRGKKATVKEKTYRRIKDACPVLKENPPRDYSVIFKEPAGPSNSLHSKLPAIVIQTNVSFVGDFPP
jgi:hypothetical protein